MKKSAFIIIILLASLNVFSQINTNETPFTINENLNKEDVPLTVTPDLNYELIYKEDSIDNVNGLPPRFGYGIDVNLNTENSGSWINLPDKSGKLWRLKIYSPKALSINLLYDKFYIPKGGKFFIYSSDGRRKLGAFTYKNNKGDKIQPGAFATSLILSDQIILEYYQPTAVKEKPIISVAKIVHGYRYIKGPKSFGDSGSCNVNINCDDGDDWQDEGTSVALIVVDGTRWCTGSLINNTADDGTPYLLTANHCLSGLDAISNPNASTWTFLWNYESPTCADGTDFTPPSTSGATVVANNSTSDFALLELDETPFDLIPALCLYHNGWSRSSASPSSPTTCIHHPSGDIKKISVDNDAPSSNGNNWRINDWDIGTTEGGSSGSPLFDANHRVVGQLYGGQAACGNNLYDDYGKFSVSWNSSNDPRRRLRDWLDPLGRNPMTEEGAYLFPVYNTNISGPTTFCASGTYTINNLPSGATVSWTISPSTAATLSASGNSVTVTGVGYNAKLTLTATLTATLGCEDALSTLSKVVYYGPPVTSLLSVWGDSFLQINQPGNFGVVYDGQNVCGSNNKASLTNFTWQYSSPANFAGEGGMACAIGTPPNAGYTITWGPGQTGSKLVHVKASNACGVSSWGPPKMVTVGGMFSINLFPNPSFDIVNISISDEAINSENTIVSVSSKKDIPYISKVTIADNMGILQKEINFHTKENNVSLPISDIAPGMYSVQIYSASELLGSKLLLVTR